MVEEYYYLNNCNGLMEQTEGWMKPEFRLLRDEQIWCPRHNRFEYIWNDSNNSTSTSRQCSITGFRINYIDKMTLYGCRILKHNGDTPIQISYYVVIKKEIRKKIKLIKRELRLTLSVKTGKAQLVFPGHAVMNLDAHGLIPSPDNTFKQNIELYRNLDEIGFDIPTIIESRIMELLCEEAKDTFDNYEQSKCGLRGFKLLFSFVERPFEPGISRLKNMAGRHFDILFPRDESDNYNRLSTYIGLDEYEAAVFKTMFEQEPYVIIALRFLHELDLDDKKARLTFIQTLSKEHFDRMFFIPFESVQYLPAEKLHLTINETEEYDYERLFENIYRYSELVKLEYGAATMINIISEYSGKGCFGDVYISGSIIEFIITYYNDVSYNLKHKILYGNLGIDTYNDLITELAHKGFIELIYEPDSNEQKAEDIIYSYKFSFIRLQCDIERIEEKFLCNISELDDEIDSQLKIMSTYFEDRMVCIMVIKGKRVKKICGPGGEKIDGRLKTTCRVWLKKYGFYANTTDLS